MNVEIIEQRARDAETNVVLCRLADASDGMRYVTWVRRNETPAGRYHGHYFADLSAAATDFEARH